MFAVDSSCLIPFLNAEQAPDLEIVEQNMRLHRVALPPVVIVECLSNDQTRHLVEGQLRKLYVLACDEEYWYRASILRARILANGFKARMADTLIAQSCIDHDVSLITRDNDFRHFAAIGGLKLAH